MQGDGLERLILDEELDPWAQPRRKQQSHGYSSTISKADLQSRFHLSIDFAALELQVGVTTLKKLCRQHGIARWPFRKVQQLIRIGKLSRAGLISMRDYKYMLELLLELDLVLDSPLWAHLDPGAVEGIRSTMLQCRTLAQSRVEGAPADLPPFATSDGTAVGGDVAAAASADGSGIATEGSSLSPPCALECTNDSMWHLVHMVNRRLLPPPHVAGQPTSQPASQHLAGGGRLQPSGADVAAQLLGIADTSSVPGAVSTTQLSPQTQPMQLPAWLSGSNRGSAAAPGTYCVSSPFSPSLGSGMSNSTVPAVQPQSVAVDSPAIQTLVQVLLTVLQGGGGQQQPTTASPALQAMLQADCNNSSSSDLLAGMLCDALLQIINCQQQPQQQLQQQQPQQQLQQLQQQPQQQLQQQPQQQLQQQPQQQPQQQLQQQQQAAQQPQQQQQAVGAQGSSTQSQVDALLQQLIGGPLTTVRPTQLAPVQQQRQQQQRAAAAPAQLGTHELLHQLSQWASSATDQQQQQQPQQASPFLVHQQRTAPTHQQQRAAPTHQQQRASIQQQHAALSLHQQQQQQPSAPTQQEQQQQPALRDALINFAQMLGFAPGGNWG